MDSPLNHRRAQVRAAELHQQAERHRLARHAAKREAETISRFAPTARLQDIRRAKTILLTTYKRDGSAVDTPVSIAFDRDRAFFRTWHKAWKAKRVARNQRVKLAPSTVRGRATGAAVSAEAILLEGHDAQVAASAVERRHPFLQRLLVPVTHRLMRYRTMHYELLWDRPAIAAGLTTARSEAQSRDQVTRRQSLRGARSAAALNAEPDKDGREPSRLGAVSGLAVVMLWSPMALVIPELPNLATASGVDHFYAEHGQLMKVILACVSLGFVFFFVFLGALIEQLRLHDGGAWTWMAFGSALMFMTALDLALGLDAAAALLHGRAESDTVWALHSAAFLLAAPAAGAGVAFFVAATALGLRRAALPGWSGRLSVVGIILNAGALGGFFATSGALNSGNGLAAGLVGPVAIWLVWIMCISLSWLNELKA